MKVVCTDSRGDRRGYLVGVAELVGVAGAGAENGPHDCTESREDEDDGGVGDGFSTCGGGVAVYDTCETASVIQMLRKLSVAY